MEFKSKINTPPIRMKDCLFLLAGLLTLAPPVFALTVDRMLGIPARSILLLSLPLLLLLAGIFFHSRKVKHGIYRLVLAGLIGGLLGTVALDSVRLIGVRLGAFPMDMPRMFGIIAAGKAPQFQTNTTARIAQLTADLPEAERKQVVEKRVHFLAGVDETSRRAFMGAMLKGLQGLAPEKRALMVETMSSYVMELPPEESQLMSASMAALLGGTPAIPKFPSGIELFLQVPRVPMAQFRKAVEISYPQTLEQSGLSDGRVMLYGYMWHFMIGSTFGITYTLLFGRGKWLWVFGWGIFVWLAMMVAMPIMMPIIDFPWWFPGVPLLAHLAMAVPIGWAALKFVDEQSDSSSFMGLLKRDRRLLQELRAA